MRMAADHARMVGERAFYTFLESTDAQHLSKHPDLPLGVGWLYAHLCLLLRRHLPAHRRSGASVAGHPCVACDAPSSVELTATLASHFSRAAATTAVVLANASVAAVSRG